MVTQWQRLSLAWYLTRITRNLMQSIINLMFVNISLEYALFFSSEKPK